MFFRSSKSVKPCPFSTPKPHKIYNSLHSKAGRESKFEVLSIVYVKQNTFFISWEGESEPGIVGGSLEMFIKWRGWRVTKGELRPHFVNREVWARNGTIYTTTIRVLWGLLSFLYGLHLQIQVSMASRTWSPPPHTCRGHTRSSKLREFEWCPHSRDDIWSTAKV